MAIPCRHIELVPEKCNICAVATKLSHMAKLWEIQSPKMDFSAIKEQAKSSRIKPCFYLGKVINRAECNCPFKFVHKCDVHGSCVIGASFNGHRSCQTCPDYDVDSEPELA
jgi:hypothetical protein